MTVFKEALLVLLSGSRISPNAARAVLVSMAVSKDAEIDLNLVKFGRISYLALSPRNDSCAGFYYCRQTQQLVPFSFLFARKQLNEIIDMAKKKDAAIALKRGF